MYVLCIEVLYATDNYLSTLEIYLCIFVFENKIIVTSAFSAVLYLVVVKKKLKSIPGILQHVIQLNMYWDCGSHLF